MTFNTDLKSALRSCIVYLDKFWVKEAKLGQWKVTNTSYTVHMHILYKKKGMENINLHWYFQLWLMQTNNTLYIIRIVIFCFTIHFSHRMPCHVDTGAKPEHVVQRKACISKLLIIQVFSSSKHGSICKREISLLPSQQALLITVAVLFNFSKLILWHHAMHAGRQYISESFYRTVYLHRSQIPIDQWKMFTVPNRGCI